MTTDLPRYFFSYARSDGDFALRVAKDLRAAGANVWVDQLDIVGGERWDKAVESALHACKGMILILSPDAVASTNVMDEVSYALEANKLVVPVLRAKCEVPFRLRRVQRVDFTASYEAGIDGLLRALKTREPVGQPAHTPSEPTGNAGRRTEGAQGPVAAQGSMPNERSAVPFVEGRRRSAILGLIIGTVCGVAWVTVAWVTSRVSDPVEVLLQVVAVVAFIDGAAGAAARAIVKNRRLPALLGGGAAAVALVIGFGLYWSIRPDDIGLMVLYVGIPLGAILGALAGVRWERWIRA